MIIGLAVAAVAFSQMVKSSGGVLTDTVAYPQKWTALIICMMYVPPLLPPSISLLLLAISLDR
jgi:hypothetical protein